MPKKRKPFKAQVQIEEITTASGTLDNKPVTVEVHGLNEEALPKLYRVEVPGLASWRCEAHDAEEAWGKYMKKHNIIGASKKQIKEVK